LITTITILTGADTKLKSAVDLSEKSESFYYLGNAVCPSVAIEQSAMLTKDFKITKNCLGSVGIEEDYQIAIFSLLSAILHIGNVSFNPNGSEGSICSVLPSSENYVESASMLLGVSAEDFTTVLSTRNMYVGGSTIVKAQSQEQAVLLPFTSLKFHSFLSTIPFSASPHLPPFIYICIFACGFITLNLMEIYLT
jgi:myosin heavy subunit